MDKEELIEYFQKYYDKVKDTPDPYDEGGVYECSGGNIDDAFQLGYSLGEKEAYAHIIKCLTPISE